MVMRSRLPSLTSLIHPLLPILRPNVWKSEPFVERGYPIHLLYSAIQKAVNNSRRHTLKPPLDKISDDKIPLVLTFYPFNYKVRDVISRNF